MPWAHFSAVLKTTANLIEIVLVNKTPVTDTCNRKDHLSHLLQLSLDPGYQNVTQGVLSFSFFFSAFSDTDFILRLDTHMVFRSWLATLELSAFPFVSSWRKKTVFTPSIYLHPILDVLDVSDDVLTTSFGQWYRWASWSMCCVPGAREASLQLMDPRWKSGRLNVH